MKTCIVEGFIRRDLEVLSQAFFSLVLVQILGKNLIVLNGIKTKLDNADRFPIRQADTPVQKRFLNKTGQNFILAGFIFIRIIPDGERQH